MDVVGLDAQFFNITTFPLEQQVNVALNEVIGYALSILNRYLGQKPLK
ncbi:MAG: hypothetical protein VB110_01525 [Bacteroidales bacterium]|nr:hypothetical protein [Bacteroidales bacterium]